MVTRKLLTNFCRLSFFYAAKTLGATGDLDMDTARLEHEFSIPTFVAGVINMFALYQISVRVAELKPLVPYVKLGLFAVGNFCAVDVIFTQLSTTPLLTTNR